MRSIITGAVAALALAVTAASASAQHPGGYNGGHSAYVAPAHSAPAYVAPGHHSSGGFAGWAGPAFGAGAYPAYNPGVGAHARPAYTPAHPVAPAYTHSYGHGRPAGHH